MSQSQMLYRLQLIDTQLDLARLRASDIELILSGNSELQQAEIALTNAEHNLEIEKIHLNKAEQVVADQRIKIEQTEAALYGGKIHVPKELQDLQKETAALKRHIVILEDRQLEHMISLEDSTAHLMKASGLVDKIKASWIEQTTNLNNELNQQINLINRLESERTSAVAPLPADILAIYTQLRKQRNCVAVVKISAKACPACGTTLSPAVLQSVQSSPILIRCPTCNRILYPG
jgi:predicted  nucleic acid-binding Zn-ribbon protein